MRIEHIFLWVPYGLRISDWRSCLKTLKTILLSTSTIYIELEAHGGFTQILLVSKSQGQNQPARKDNDALWKQPLSPKNKPDFTGEFSIRDNPKGSKILSGQEKKLHRSPFTVLETEEKN